MMLVCIMQAHSRGGAMGTTAPNPKVEPKFFRLIKLFMCKPNKYFSANQRKLLKKPIQLQLSVEPGQSRMVYQLSMNDQTLCIL